MPTQKPDSRVSYFRVPRPDTHLPYRIRRVGRNRYVNYHSTRGTYHQDATINLFMDGLGHYYRGEEHVLVKPGDVLLVAGKGHETGQTVGTLVVPFSDHDAVAAALKQEASCG